MVAQYYEMKFYWMRKRSKEAVQPKDRPIKRLVRESEVIDPILLPALFVVVIAERLFFAVADRLKAIGWNTLLEKSLLNGFGAARSESEVVFDRTAVIAVPLNEDVDARMLLEESGILL